MKKVIISEPIHEDGITLLKKAGFQVEVAPTTEKNMFINALEGAYGLILRASKMDQEMIEKAKDLKIIARHGIGVDNVDIEAANRQHILVTNVPTANVYAVAEYTLGAILMSSRRYFEANQWMRTEDFAKRKGSLPGLTAQDQMGGNEIAGKMLGIIGLGNIGIEVARLARAFGMQVCAYSRHEKNLPGVKWLSSPEQVFEVSDFISVNIPLTPNTRHMIDGDAFDVMKSSAYLINSSRGGVVDDLALATALKEGKIGGAVIDVYESEPPQNDSQLYSAPNLIMTPHFAGTTQEAMQKMGIEAAQSIIDYERGLRPVSVINPEILK